jgi:hypothetical protein
MQRLKQSVSTILILGSFIATSLGTFVPNKHKDNIANSNSIELLQNHNNLEKTEYTFEEIFSAISFDGSSAEASTTKKPIPKKGVKQLTIKLLKVNPDRSETYLIGDKKITVTAEQIALTGKTLHEKSKNGDNISTQALIYPGAIAGMVAWMQYATSLVSFRATMFLTTHCASDVNRCANSI